MFERMCKKGYRAAQRFGAKRPEWAALLLGVVAASLFHAEIRTAVIAVVQVVAFTTAAVLGLRWYVRRKVKP